MLESLVTRLNTFMEICFNRIGGLCVSKQQEKTVEEMQLQVKQVVSQTEADV